MFELVAPLNEVNIGDGYMIEESVAAYINDAAKATDIDVGYLLAKAYQESGFSSHALADTTSAVGMYQFTEETWLAMMRLYGKKYGYGYLSEQIETGRRGNSFVKDEALKKAILDLRHDAKVASIMAAEYAKSNKSYLQSVIKRKVTSSDLYIAHFLGPRGASILINAEKNGYFGVLAAADLFPDAAKANKSVFFKKNGTPYTVLEVRNNIEELFLKGIKRFSDLPEEVLASLPVVSLKKYNDMSLTAPVETLEEQNKRKNEMPLGIALDDIEIFSNYAYLDYENFDEYAEGYDIDNRDKNFDYASLLGDGISRTSIKVIP